MVSEPHGLLRIRPVARVRVPGVHATSAIASGPGPAVGVVVVDAEIGGTGVGGGVCCGEGDVPVEFLGAAAADGVGDEGDDDGEGDETDDGEDACDGTFVVEEAAGGDGLVRM